jgi:CDP-glycerol glycerophosphotransferase (TagB/SpsB family)
MDKLRNEGLMATIVHELEELKNCQKAIMQKLAKIEVANLRLDNENLEALLPELQQRVTDNLFAITNALEEFLNQKKEPKPADNVVDLMQAS